MTLFPKDLIQQRSPTLWRYAEALPTIDAQARVSFHEGFTPLVPYAVGEQTVWLKLDFLFPTGSYKDRGATVLMSQARQKGISFVVQDSSGNAGCAIAGYAARAGIGCRIFVPADTSPAKVAQIRLYGAEVVRVQGSREDTAHACLQAAQEHFYASHVYNDAFLEGTKTFAFEVWEQLGWNAPDTVVLPAGNGTLLLGAYKGFSELLQAGEISRLPKLIAVQARNCAPLFHAFEGLSSPTWEATLAEGIAIAAPHRQEEMLQAVRATGGHFIAVGEADIRQEVFALARAGYYVEPTSACIAAGLRQYMGQLACPETVVSVLTGTGLKATEKMLKLITQP